MTELFDWDRRKGDLATRFDPGVIPFPYKYVGVSTIELTADGAQAHTQLADLVIGSLPEGKLSSLRLDRILGEDSLRSLSHNLGYHFGDGNYQIDWADNQTLHSAVACAWDVVPVFMNVLADLEINPSVPDSQRIFARMETWGNEALDRDSGEKVGSFYHYAYHEGYDYPWVPGAIAPPPPYYRDYLVFPYFG